MQVLILDSIFYFVSRFPSNPNLKKQWVLAIRRKNFKPSSWTKICSAHFLPEDFLVRPGTYVRRLKETAVPSVFAFSSSSQLKSKKQRSERSQSMDSEVSSETSSTPDEIIETVSDHKKRDILLNVKLNSKETQTIECLPPNGTDFQQMERKIRILKQKITQRDVEIKNLKDLVSSLKDQGLIDEELVYM